MKVSELIEILMSEDGDAKAVIDTGFECVDVKDVIDGLPFFRPLSMC